MDDIPRIRNATLTDTILVRLDVDLGQEVREIKSRHKVDVQEMIRRYLRAELPKIKKRLET